MPKQVLPDAEKFSLFTWWMTSKLDFRKIEPVEFKSDMVRLGLKAPRHREGREVGFSYWANGLIVNVWTTFLSREGKARDEDAGWVLIKEGDEVRYFAGPFRRTSGFLRRLYRYAEICRKRVLHRPLCPVCKNFMAIEYGREIGARYWSCFQKTFHPKPQFVSWDYGLSEEDRDYLKAYRRARSLYRNERKKEGKPLHVARLTRAKHGWKTTRPENLVPAR